MFLKDTLLVLELDNNLLLARKLYKGLDIIGKFNNTYITFTYNSNYKLLIKTKILNRVYIVLRYYL